MNNDITIRIDGVDCSARPGENVMQAADANGIYIPRLCWMKGMSPIGACRVCTCKVDGRTVAACTEPVRDGMEIENDTPEMQDLRRSVTEMLFVEGNHYCMYCEASGNCELQATAYRLGVTAPSHSYQFPDRPIDSTHPDIFVDRNRCILCGRCVRAARELDGKATFQFIGRGSDRHIGVNSSKGLGGTQVKVTDASISSCPVGCLIPKRVGFNRPVGQRIFDLAPIGTEIERRRQAPKEVHDD
ncbi:NADP oxidoreductase [bacterium]|nr:MAG: NADP oxidoreductase [bacterium]